MPELDFTQRRQEPQRKHTPFDGNKMLSKEQNVEECVLTTGDDENYKA